jgi:hypothetical protein
MKEVETEKKTISSMWEGALKSIEVDFPIGYHKVEDDDYVMQRGDMYLVPFSMTFEPCPPKEFKAEYFLYPITKN